MLRDEYLGPNALRSMGRYRPFAYPKPRRYEAISAHTGTGDSGRRNHSLRTSDLLDSDESHQPHRGAKSIRRPVREAVKSYKNFQTFPIVRTLSPMLFLLISRYAGPVLEFKATDTSCFNRNYTSSTSSSHPFSEFNIKAPRFNLVLARLTGNTYVLVVLPPGEADINCTRANIAMARDEFSALDGLGGSGKMG